MSVGEMSFGEMSFGEMSFGEISFGEISFGKCPSEKRIVYIGDQTDILSWFCVCNFVIIISEEM